MLVLHGPIIRAGLLRLKRLQVVAEACGNIGLPRAMSWSDAETKVGHLSPWETCKAFAFYTALEAISKQLGQPAYALLGQRAPAWIAEQLTRKGGGCPSERAVLAAVSKCQQPTWFPGQGEVVLAAPHWTCLCA